METPTSFIVHSRRELNTALREGQYFFTDIRREGVVVYELDDEPLAKPRALTSKAVYEAALEHFQERLPGAAMMLETAELQLGKADKSEVWGKGAAFSLHQAIEHAYATLLLVLTNYSPPSHKLTFLRALAEDQDRRLTAAWPRDQQRYRAWFNTLNEAYVKARYSKHYAISEEALAWLGERIAELHKLVEEICREHLTKLKEAAGEGAGHRKP